MLFLPLLFLAGLQAAAQTPAPDAETRARYRACVDRVRAAPEAGVQEANSWRIVGGGIYARQCLGLAYVALGRWSEAAEDYEQGARDLGPADPRAADFWVQAGNAWLAASQAARAIQAFDSALAGDALTDQMRGEVRLDRARALVSAGSLPSARADLDLALRLVADDPMAWYLSAALAHRQHEARARADIEHARQLAPDNPDVLLLAGTIAGEAGDMDEAERLYRQVVAAAPDSDAGHAAAASLATMHEVEAPGASAGPGANAAPPAPAAPAPTPHSR
jgi:tetratricopeptide (TPR) repeat protein